MPLDMSRGSPLAWWQFYGCFLWHLFVGRRVCVGMEGLCIPGHDHNRGSYLGLGCWKRISALMTYL
eukprot:15341039-Ditylum_brightwellii.AAC.1